MKHSDQSLTVNCKLYEKGKFHCNEIDNKWEFHYQTPFGAVPVYTLF